MREDCTSTCMRDECLQGGGKRAAGKAEGRPPAYNHALCRHCAGRPGAAGYLCVGVGAEVGAMPAAACDVADPVEWEVCITMGGALRALLVRFGGPDCTRLRVCEAPSFVLERCGSHEGRVQPT